MPDTMRRRLLLAGGAVALGTLGFSGYVILTGPEIVIPDDSCAERPPLRSVAGVRLQPPAMAAFRQARRDAGVPIEVVHSYRSCSEQRRVCRAICGDPNGCPGLCAPPGLSWHQLGAAIDITQASLDQDRIVEALENNGWCQSVPDTDPGHFSYDGCH
jgi:hypothetical protein